ncbi:MAG: phosphoribosylformylglycinamidine synthase [Cardiobacteriaceae bacterium]|nr:phosphoribosylformylglycinamidine synthase [Cardiobacteriaceae bacterium]
MDIRLIIEKRPAFSDDAQALASLKHVLSLPNVTGLKRFALYDLHHCPLEVFEQTNAQAKVFADPITDIAQSALPEGDFTLIIEPLAGQFDQRADSAEQCLKLLAPEFAGVRVLSAVAWVFTGNVSAEEQSALRHYLINPIETREKDLAQTELPIPQRAPDVPTFEGFCALDASALQAFHQAQSLSMTLADLALVQRYFQSENREPSETEIRVLDTYWSDHCRHTTFATHLQAFEFPESALGAALKADFEDYNTKRFAIYGDKAEKRPYTLMDLATIDAKYQRQAGALDDVEFSAEVNACSVFVEVDEEGKTEKWLLQFKNETHNHPTEIEPFGGAATCIGGAIRDPLSGRAYVYQAMRVSGCADPREALSETLAGKLPQRLIAQGAAAGSSSYGNQIGLATGQIVEYYHEGYKAKHMEVGAVVAAVPAHHVKREEPQAGDVVLLIGGATGRDGCGGATGSSKSQHGNSLQESAAEVQKGNAPEERKLQRLFRQSAFASRIKRCNDFGAGGVSVAIGELADGLDINLDLIPVKYQGLSGTELAISESQERMAIVVSPNDVALMQALAAAENLNATAIATITDDATLTMRHREQVIVSLKRAFLDSNGATVQQNLVRLPNTLPQIVTEPENWQSALHDQLSTLAFADQRGLGDRFDHSVGASCVLLPYGGKTQRSPVEASVYALPTETTTHTASILAHGFNPHISSQSAYHGGLLAVIDATSRVVATGGNARKTHYSLQEYFRRLGQNAENWGQVFAALLGAHHALSALNRAAIGGKDSMSGSFQDLHVPPTLIAFAVTTVHTDNVISPEFKATGDYVYLLTCRQDDLQRPVLSDFIRNNDFIFQQNQLGNIKSARAIRHGGVIQALYESALGNEIGVSIQYDKLFAPQYGAYLITSAEKLSAEGLIFLGQTIAEPELRINGKVEPLSALYQTAVSVLHDVYPLYEAAEETEALLLATSQTSKALWVPSTKVAKPRVCLPVFFGMNSELDTRRAFERNGAVASEVLIRNRSFDEVEESLNALEKTLKMSQILVISGGFSAGDEPDGSGKFIANILSSDKIRSAIDEFLARDGLILGICNGFQALIKTGLLTHSRIQTPQAHEPTLAHNRIRRHIARVATTVVANNHSVWLRDFAVGQLHDVSFSHGEGRFYANQSALDLLLQNGQIAFQYANPESALPSQDPRHNPNGSVYAIEGITSPCGRILGKMGHSERHNPTHGQLNFPHFRDQNIFKAGVQAFS